MHFSLMIAERSKLYYQGYLPENVTMLIHKYLYTKDRHTNIYIYTQKTDTHILTQTTHTKHTRRMHHPK